MTLCFSYFWCPSTEVTKHDNLKAHEDKPKHIWVCSVPNRRLCLTGTLYYLISIMDQKQDRNKYRLLKLSLNRTKDPYTLNNIGISPIGLVLN